MLRNISLLAIFSVKIAAEGLGSLGGLGLVVHFGAFVLLGFEFLLFLELAFGFFDTHVGVHFEEVSEVVVETSSKYHVGIVCRLASE